MSENTEPAWPQTPEGVTDWEFVFENEGAGFIPLCLLANSPLILKECATVVIQQLFTRDDDSMNIMKYIIALNDIIPDEKELDMDVDNLKVMRTEVTELLRKIKTDRQNKSKEYLKRKAREAQDRRMQR